MEELIESIDGFPDYIISNYGTIQNVRTGRYIKPQINSQGHLCVALYQDGIRKNRSVGRLVAETFVPVFNLFSNDAKFNTVLYLDNDLKNVRSDNLVWRPRDFVYTYRLEFASIQMGWRLGPFELLETGEVFNTPRECATRYGALEYGINCKLYKLFYHGTQTNRLYPIGSVTFRFV